MTDITREWKNKKFVLLDSDFTSVNQKIVLLTDYVFWADHTDDLIAWCRSYDAIIQGMTVKFKNEQDATMFILRWS